MMVQESGGAKAAEEAIRHPVAATGAAAERRSTLKPPEQVLKCPRCDSLNTKFCYYNNYSLTQPRHFCKSCRRYWTKGGALRNVPIGGGCRKNKRANKQNPQRTAAGPPAEPKRHPVDREPPPSSTASDVTGGLTLFQSLSQPAGSFMEFPGLAFTRLQEPVTAVTSGAEIFGQRAPLPTSSTTSILQSSCQALANLPPLETTLLGLRTENLIGGSGDLNGLFESPNVHPQDYFNAADLQWRIHQHRLAMLAADQNEAEKENISRLHIKPCKPEFPYFDNANRSEWQAAATAAITATGGGGGGHHPFDGTVESAAAYWNPLAAWSDLQLYATSAGALP